MKYVQYIETDGSEIVFPLTNAVISSVDCQIHFEYVPLNGTVHYDAFYTFLFGLRNKITFRTVGGGYQVNNPYQIIFGDAGSFVGGTAPSFPVGTKYSCILDKYGINVNGTQYNFTSPATSIPNLNCVFNAEYNGTRITRCPLARYISLKVVLNGNDICNYKAAVDDNNVPCFYDEVSQTYAYNIGSGTPTAGPDIVTDTNLVPVNKYKLYTSNIQKTYNGSTQINKMYVGNDLVYRALPSTTGPQLTMPLDEVWYKTLDNGSFPPKSNTYYIDSNYNRLTYTESFDSESGLWKMKFNGNVYGNQGSLYYVSSQNDRLLELWLPYGFVRPNDIFIYGQDDFQKFKGDSPAIKDNGNFVVCLVQDSTNTKDYVVQAVKNATTVTVPEGVVAIGAYGFYHLRATTVNLPSTISKLDYASMEYTTITTLNCYAPTPPTVDSMAWYRVHNNGTLHYPSSSDYSTFTVPSEWTKVGDL